MHMVHLLEHRQSSSSYARGTLTGTQTLRQSVLVVAMHVVHLQGHRQSVLVAAMHIIHLQGHTQSVLLVAMHVVHLQGHSQF